MLFAVALTLASTAMAGIVARDASTVEGVMTTVGKDIAAVKAAAEAYQGDKTELVKASDQLVADLKAGKAKVDSGPDLDANDAINLTGSVDKLTKAGTALSDTLARRKPDVEKAGECKTVQGQISAIAASSEALIKSVVAKVPEAAQGIAGDLAGKLTTVLEQTRDSYSDCQDSGSSSKNGGGGGGGNKSPGSGGSTTGSAKPTGSGASTPAATGTGGLVPTSSQVSMPTAGAAAYAPAGVLAAVAAALAL